MSTKLSKNDSILQEEANTLFILDERTGKVHITRYAREFYTNRGLDAKKEAYCWEQRLRRALDAR
jgi:hypothetical protein